MAKRAGPGTQKTTATRISPARLAAFHILTEISRSASTHSDDLLQSDRVDRLSSQDRNLCMTLTMGVLRWQPLLDDRIAGLLTHKSRLDEPVRIALRLAMFQLLLLDRIPAHAAISDSVELTKRAGHTFASGLVNAVLRKVAAVQHESPLDPVQAHPAWLVQRWSAELGADSAAAICAYDQQQPQVSVRMTTPDAEAALADEGVTLAPGHFLRDARRVLSGDVVNTIAVRDGLVRIQDEGSQLVAELLGGGKTIASSILDSCAAPGGKTAILAERYPAASITAADVSATRVARMEAWLKEIPGLARIECRVQDALHPAAGETFDRILCDVPCSGTGTLAHNPEIKLRLHADDLLRQQQRQIAILQASLRLLAMHGQLVYSTCSLEPEENEHVIQAVLGTVAGVHVVPVRQRIEELGDAGVLHRQGADALLTRGVRGDFLRTTPGVFAMDGFFAAVFVHDGATAKP